jgi:hypothetical protein
VRDRSASLMVQAAAAGVVDFSAVDPFDKRSILKLRLLLKEMERRIQEKQAGVMFSTSLACLIANKQEVTHPDYGNTADWLNDRQQRLINLALPLLADIVEASDEKQLETATDRWEATFGCKIDGPEVQVTANLLKKSFEQAQRAAKRMAEDEQALMQITSVKQHER